MSSALTLQQHEEPLAHEKRQQHRRRLLLAPDLALLSERELETALSDIDRAGLQLQSATSGPFSVFAVTTTVHDAAVPSAVTPALSSDAMMPNSATKCFDTQASPSDDSPEAQWQTDSLSAISVRSQPAGDEHSNPKTQSSPSTPYVVHVSNATDNPLGVAVIAAGHMLEQPVASETVVDPPSLSSSRDAEAPQQSTHPRPQPHVVCLPPPAASDPRSGFLTPNVRFLLQNYADNVVPILGTLDTSHNPWKEVHLPQAMLCSIELDILGHSTRSKRALLHTVLAVSAYNINNIQSRTAEDTDSRKWSYLASDYKCQALSLLEACVGASQGTLDFPVYNEILAAMLSMVTIDVMSADTKVSGIHLRACHTLIQEQLRKVKGHIPEPSKGLHTIFLYIRTMQEATELFCENFNSVVTPTPDELAITGSHLENLTTLITTYEAAEPFSWWSSAIVYGIPSGLLLLIRKANMLIRSRRKFQSNDNLDGIDIQPGHAEFEGFEDFEEEILGWPVEEITARFEDAPVSPENRLIMQLYTRAFHKALIIFYCRKCLHMNQRHLQPYVHQVIEYLEQIALVKKEHGLRAGSMIWPAFVAGSQALRHDIQTRFLGWFDLVGTEGVGTFSLSKKALQRIWDRPRASSCLSSLDGFHLVLT